MVMVVVIVIVAVIGIGIVFWLPLWCLTWTQVRAPTPCRSHVLNCVHHGFMIAQCLTRTKFIRWDLKRFTYSLFCSRDLLTRFGGRFVTLFKEFPSGLGVPPPPPGHWGIVHWHRWGEQIYQHDLWKQIFSIKSFPSVLIPLADCCLDTWRRGITSRGENGKIIWRGGKEESAP